MSESSSQHLRLVEQMGAQRFEGFNPIAPRSHRWMMDHSQSEEIRAFGWGLWRTIDRDPDGKTGPPKLRRTPIAHDSRVSAREHLGVEHMAEDLGISVANATDALRRNGEKGRMRRDEKGRIWVRGDAPLPRRIKSKTPDDEDEVFFSTEKTLRAMCLSFQQLDKNRRIQYVQRYLDAPKPFRQHLESLPAEPRA
ncbi:MAG TPA: hypothetical protein VGL97_05120, partial [Bryobacteraceae bacterium]